jgi:hypothetical protein
VSAHRWRDRWARWPGAGSNRRPSDFASYGGQLLRLGTAPKYSNQGAQRRQSLVRADVSVHVATASDHGSRSSHREDQRCTKAGHPRDPKPQKTSTNDPRSMTPSNVIDRRSEALSGIDHHDRPRVSGFGVRVPNGAPSVQVRTLIGIPGRFLSAIDPHFTPIFETGHQPPSHTSRRRRYSHSSPKSWLCPVGGHPSGGSPGRTSSVNALFGTARLQVSNPTPRLCDVSRHGHSPNLIWVRACEFGGAVGGRGDGGRVSSRRSSPVVAWMTRMSRCWIRSRMWVRAWVRPMPMWCMRPSWRG